jgi:glycosidase
VFGGLQSGVDTSQSPDTRDYIWQDGDIQEWISFGVVGSDKDFISQMSNTEQDTLDERLTEEIQEGFITPHATGLTPSLDG